MKILLVLPAAEHLRVTSPEQRVPNRAMLRFSVLPLTAVAAATPPEHSVEICDENVTPLDLEADVDVVGISFMTALAPRAYEIAAAFRARGRVVVGGGYHPTLAPDDAAPHFDALVLGDAEEQWPRLLEDLESGVPRSVYDGRGGCDLSRVPPPRRDLTAGTARHYVTTNAVQTGRGCNHGCAYCSIAAFHGSRHRSRPLERVLAELRELPREVMFIDDNIIADPEYARRLFRAMRGMDKLWVSQCSITVADDAELLELAHAAGCRGLFVGVETTSAANLESVGKGFNATRGIRERIAAIRSQGIGVIAGMMVGMDHDDPDTFRSTLEFLVRSGLDALQLNIMTPLPGTPLFERLERAGRIRDRDWSHYDFRHAVIEPARMSAAELQEGADWLLRQFYRLDRVLLRVLRCLVTAGPVPAWLAWRLNLTYRYDVRRLGLRGRDPGRAERGAGAGRRLVPRAT
jgi:radical SAM superfamily enzyme YgiQ (UPF0313 family)